MSNLKILYQIPSLETVYAARFIYEGYKDAFQDLGYEFQPLTAKMSSAQVFKAYNPDIFITGLGEYNLKFINLELINKYRQRGLVMFTQIPAWKKICNQYGSGDLESNKKFVSLIEEGLAGDIFFTWIEQDDPVMKGFKKKTGYSFQTILLAANKKLYYPEYDKRFECDICFVGNNLPDKKAFFKSNLLPLKEKYDVKIYGNDWVFSSRTKGYIQKVGQYFNLGPLKKIRNIVLDMQDERKVYSSSTISLNIHEEHQRRLGCDFNERTFKIIASGGFEICDNVRVLRKYFTEKELVIGENTKDWFEKIDYYIKNPGKRVPIINAGRKKVLAKHTYHNRAQQFIDLYEKFKKGKTK